MLIESKTMKAIDFWSYGSKLRRDGLLTHAMLIDGVRATCGAGGVSFGTYYQYRLNTDGSFFEIASFGPRKCSNPITCKKCLEKLFPRLDEYKRPIPIEVGEYRYMGHFIQDQREWVGRGLPPWVTIADTEPSDNVPHSSFSDAKTHCKENRIDNPDTPVQDYP